MFLKPFCDFYKHSAQIFHLKTRQKTHLTMLNFYYILLNHIINFPLLCAFQYVLLTVLDINGGVFSRFLPYACQDCWFYIFVCLCQLPC